MHTNNLVVRKTESTCDDLGARYAFYHEGGIHVRTARAPAPFMHDGKTSQGAHAVADSLFVNATIMLIEFAIKECIASNDWTDSYFVERIIRRREEIIEILRLYAGAYPDKQVELLIQNNEISIQSVVAQILGIRSEFEDDYYALNRIEDAAQETRIKSLQKLTGHCIAEMASIYLKHRNLLPGVTYCKRGFGEEKRVESQQGARVRNTYKRMKELLPSEHEDIAETISELFDFIMYTTYDEGKYINDAYEGIMSKIPEMHRMFYVRKNSLLQLGLSLQLFLLDTWTAFNFYETHLVDALKTTYLIIMRVLINAKLQNLDFSEDINKLNIPGKDLNKELAILYMNHWCHLLKRFWFTPCFYSHITGESHLVIKTIVEERTPWKGTVKALFIAHNDGYYRLPYNYYFLKKNFAPYSDITMLQQYLTQLATSGIYGESLSGMCNFIKRLYVASAYELTCSEDTTATNLIHTKEKCAKLVLFSYEVTQVARDGKTLSEHMNETKEEYTHIPLKYQHGGERSIKSAPLKLVI